MAKVVNIHPIGFHDRPHFHHPNLFEALREPLSKRGHELIPASRISEADVVNFDTGVWDLADNNDGTPRGTYSPYDWNALNTVINKKIPVAIHDNFDHRGTDTYFCTWPGRNDWDDLLPVQHQDWARFLYTIGKARHPLIYLMRKMQKSAPYPDWVYPLEYPMFEDFPLVSPESLYNRPYDVCFLGEQSDIRNNAMADLRADGRLKLDVQHIPSDKRMDYQVWLDRHRQAKMFMECDCSMGSERPQRLITIAPMLRVLSDHRIPYPREDMVNQVEVGDYDGHLNNEDISKILAVVNDKDLLYNIYVSGAEHMRKFYSLEARSNYVIGYLENLCR
jgi:hypothetical protein